ncbi:energy-coupling factor transport system substrate-specific component [Caminicella sporogenes DSM 14501]|uniref:Energy-coupling factor transport system substrate-specific component n=1 Tax=Caminicella sporogenes DSM 14501 TaxID=1121266 RepID=A0A1M6PDB1_9FIRM|nr:ECF transporter S component [Caminicella sporogenes]RKD21443.1 ECF transporter S component [Caminicella sporogenes]WIF95416.1 ECF transporter S component [Caminicella sporogenes]SHK05904.1 energy-coupling factor transport system substrate-specific component [Caminicella sporogenes DSM 14501]
MKNSFIIIILIIILILAISVIPENPFYNIFSWPILSAVIIGLIMLTFFWKFEKKEMNSKEVPLISTMATLAAISRIPFAALMSVQPTTFIVMITGYVFGMQIGFMVGAVAALVSNFFLGQGPWTPWQMFCWGLCGVLAAILGKRKREFNLKQFAVLSGICGYLFGWIMNIWHWIGFVYPLTLKTFISTYIASIPFDTLHAVGNVIFSILFGKSFYYILTRFKKRIC